MKYFVSSNVCNVPRQGDFPTLKLPLHFALHAFLHIVYLLLLFISSAWPQAWSKNCYVRPACNIQWTHAQQAVLEEVFLDLDCIGYGKHSFVKHRDATKKRYQFITVVLWWSCRWSRRGKHSYVWCQLCKSSDADESFYTLRKCIFRSRSQRVFLIVQEIHFPSLAHS